MKNNKSRKENIIRSITFLAIFLLFWSGIISISESKSWWTIDYNHLYTGIVKIVGSIIALSSLFIQRRSIKSVDKIIIGIALLAIVVFGVLRVRQFYFFKFNIEMVVYVFLPIVSGFMLLFLNKSFSYLKVTLGAVIFILVLGSIIPFTDGPSRRARDGATKGNLAALRGAISIYYSEKQGIWPDDLTSGFTSYLYPIPPAKATELDNSNVVTIVDGPPTTKGKGWAYNPKTGDIWANSMEKDTKGVPFSTY